jgi:GntR family transcriptional regulator / MocR family aminotransferase
MTPAKHRARAHPGRGPDTVPMQLTLSPDGEPRYQQIYASFRAAILGGTLRRGDRLPSTRILARDLGVSRTTVLGAFARLLAEGYVTGKAGAGTRVAAELPVERRRVPASTAKRETTPSIDPESLVSDSARAIMTEGRWRNIPTQPVPFALGIPELKVFPLTSWTRLAARRWRLSGRELLLPGRAEGYAPLREAVARYAVTARGVRCTPEQVMIVNGAQHALDLCARCLVGPGDAVWMESPPYQPARGVFAATGARLVDVPLDDEGLDVDRGRDIAPKARVAFVTPSFQWPLGITMTLSRRLALLEWAREANAWIIEDDYNGEYRYDTAPIPALQGLDAHGRVLYIGTFCKTLAPAIRLGYLILPMALAETFTRVRRLLDWHSPVPEQAVLADFIAGGHFARHIRRTRTLYQDRQRTFISLASRELSGLVTLESAPAGMHLVGWLDQRLDDREVAAEARQHGVVVEPLSAHLGAAPRRSALLFSYVSYTPAQMRIAMRALAGAITRCAMR